MLSFNRLNSGLGNLGSGAGKGGGGGGSIREAGGSMGQREAANEEEYFYKQVNIN
jgi:5-formyltetrahydrofolate cyclo-ligase